MDIKPNDTIVVNNDTRTFQFVRRGEVIREIDCLDVESDTPYILLLANTMKYRNCITFDKDDVTIVSFDTVRNQGHPDYYNGAIFKREPDKISFCVYNRAGELFRRAYVGCSDGLELINLQRFCDLFGLVAEDVSGKDGQEEFLLKLA